MVTDLSSSPDCNLLGEAPEDGGKARDPEAGPADEEPEELPEAPRIDRMLFGASPKNKVERQNVAILSSDRFLCAWCYWGWTTSPRGTP